ncbi:hypothetical protein EAX61_10335 [Dokdonia sinensis]|uniref:Uncharacterized protein n=1 Tax=Dokdonia sinensis TaxID=2479847 RepID=A0A3M0G1K1_9FLAO|nr:DUF6175 family protein [Dokdonia sinensis]RMB58007.1 hypothetical protein EAX61_10335 [Dokdonia sinensis]
MNINTRIIVLFLMTAMTAFAQETRTIQPSVMVIPRASEGEDLRTIIDARPEIRVAISSVKQGFDARGYDTKDFETLLKALLRDEAVTQDNQSEFRNRIFQNAGTDIVVEIDFMLNKSSSGNSVRIVLEANETDSGNSLSSKICESNKFYTEDIGKLSDMAIKSCIEPFLETMNEKFDGIVKDGKRVKIDFSFDQDSEWTMNSNVPSKNDKLKYILEDWLYEEAYKNYAQITTVTDTKMVVEEFRYPLRDPKTNKNNTPRTVERTIDRFFGRLDIPVQIDNKNSTLYVTIK